MNIDDLTGVIVAQVKALLPKLRQCERHHGRFDTAALKRAVQGAPAVFVSCLGFPQVASRAGGDVAVTAQMAAFVVTRDIAGLDRTAAAAAIAMALVELVNDNRWDSDETFDPEAIRAENLFNDQLEGIGCTIWVVSWRQDLLAGEDVYADDGTVLEHLYVSMSPEIGLAHKQDYRDIETGEAPPA